MRMAWVAFLIGAMATQVLGGPHVVLYSQGLALVEETRNFELSTEGTLRLNCIPHQVLLDSLTLDGVTVLSLVSTLPNRITPDGLIGEIVQVVSEGETIKGRLISANEDVLVLKEERGGGL